MSPFLARSSVLVANGLGSRSVSESHPTPTGDAASNDGSEPRTSEWGSQDASYPAMSSSRTGDSMLLTAAVTDDAAFAEWVRCMLVPAGFSVVAVSSGPALPRRLSDPGTELVVLDWSGERPDRIKLLRRVCAIVDAPVIVLTRGYEPGTVARILTAGADDVIERSTHGAVVVARMRAVLRRYRRRPSRSAI